MAHDSHLHASGSDARSAHEFLHKNSPQIARESSIGRDCNPWIAVSNSESQMTMIASLPLQAQPIDAWFPSEPELVQSVDVKTFHQIRDLSVRCDGCNVVVRGSSRSYYVKQLATRAIRDLVPHAEVENAIAVANS